MLKKIIAVTALILGAASLPSHEAEAQTKTTSGGYVSMGPGLNQYGLAITTGTKLTVPNGAMCAEITVETAQVRRTTDGTTPTTGVGTLLQVGSQYSDCGPLANEQFTAVSGSPTLDVEYFK